MHTTFKLEKKSIKEDEENYHLTFKDYRGSITRKLDESTARLLISELDKEINFTEKI